MADIWRSVLVHGRATTAFQALKPTLKHWTAAASHADAAGHQDAEPGAGSPGPDTRIERAVIAYHDTGRAWVGAGDPLCAPEDSAAVTHEFFRAAAARGRRVSLFASERLASALPTGMERLKLGEQPVLSTERWPDVVARSRTLRSQLSRARAKGVRVFPLPPAALHDPTGPWRTAVAALVQRWLSGRALPPLGFIVELTPFDHTAWRHLYVACQAGKLVGFAGATPIPARRGVLIEELIRDPNAPNGTTELLVDAILREARGRGQMHATLGLAPLAAVDDPLLRLARKLGDGFYRFRQLRDFKAKFQPSHWEPVYSVYPAGEHRYRVLADSLRAFANQSFVVYGLRALLRGSSAALRLLGGLLLAWTGVLAAADQRWFPSPLAHALWVAFDVWVALLLFVQARRFRPDLGRCLLAATALDSIGSPAAALAYNADHLQGSFDPLILGGICLAPPLAFLTVLGAQRRHRPRPPLAAPLLGPPPDSSTPHPNDARAAPAT